MTVVVRLLGPVTVDADGRPVALGGPRPRALVAVLAAAGGAAVAPDRLAEAVWSDRDRPATRGTLHVHVHAVRQALDSAGIASGSLELTTGGYRLSGLDVDVRMAEDRISAARAADRAGDPAGAAASYRAALEFWRGEFCGDLPDHTAFHPARALYEELRLEALEQRITADLRSGERAGVVAELDALVARHPMRERLWAQLMIALYSDGRPADALGCYRRARAALAEEAGLDPGTALRALERAILDRAGTTTLLRAAVPGARTGGRATLTWVDGDGTVRTRDLGPVRTVIGRAGDADVPLRHDPAVSRRHAAVVVRDGCWRIADLGSRNGTFRNGVRVEGSGVDLAAGDLLRCGDSVLAVVERRPGPVVQSDETVPPRAGD